MTPLVKEFVKVMVDANIDPTAMQWFDVTESIRNFGGVDPKKYLLNQPPYKNVMLVGRMGEFDFMISILFENQISVITGWLMNLKEYKSLGSFILAEHNGEPKVGPVDNEKLPEFEQQRLMVHTIAGFYASLDKPTQAYIPTPHKANLSRAKRGLKPLYEWHTIVVEQPQAKQEHQGGTHASPRRHQARGHWRTYKSGKRGWVKECWRGDASKGTIFKDYVVKELP